MVHHMVSSHAASCTSLHRQAWYMSSCSKTTPQHCASAFVFIINTLCLLVHTCLSSIQRTVATLLIHSRLFSSENATTLSFFTVSFSTEGKSVCFQKKTYMNILGLPAGQCHRRAARHLFRIKIYGKMMWLPAGKCHRRDARHLFIFPAGPANSTGKIRQLTPS